MLMNKQDFSTWAKHASEPVIQSFAARAELASLFIRAGDVVCDLGAGAQPLKDFLPEGAGYIPVDCVAVIPGTHIANFNDPDFTLPLAPFNVVAALGLFSWISDLQGFLSRLASECEGKFIIFSYDFWELNERYKKHGVQNGFAELHEGEAFFSRYVRGLTAVTVSRRRVLFTGVLGPSGVQPVRRRSATEIILKYLRPADYLFIKVLGERISPRWLA